MSHVIHILCEYIFLGVFVLILRLPRVIQSNQKCHQIHLDPSTAPAKRWVFQGTLDLHFLPWIGL